MTSLALTCIQTAHDSVLVRDVTTGSRCVREERGNDDFSWVIVLWFPIWNDAIFWLTVTKLLAEVAKFILWTAVAIVETDVQKERPVKNQ